MEFVTVSLAFQRLAISMELNSITDYYRSLWFPYWTCLLNFEGNIFVLIDLNTVEKLSY